MQVKNNEPPDNRQLNLFSWQTDILAEGWRYASGFEFDKASEKFLYVLENYSNDEEAPVALDIISKWKDIFMELEKEKPQEKIHLLYLYICDFVFPRSWGPPLFKEALLNKVISLAKDNGMLFVNKNTTTADIFIMLNKPEKAEKTYQDYFCNNLESSGLLSRLADIQWKLGKYADARMNYQKALLLNPHEINPDKLENKKLASIIHEHGSEFASSWAWISGQLPLIDFLPENKVPDSTRKGLYSYYLLWKLESNQFRNLDLKEKVKARKELFSINNELYSAYFDLLKKRKL